MHGDGEDKGAQQDPRIPSSFALSLPRCCLQAVPPTTLPATPVGCCLPLTGLAASRPPHLAGNYTEYVKQKEERSAQQWVAWEKQQKEIARQVRGLYASSAPLAGHSACGILRLPTCHCRSLPLPVCLCMCPQRLPVCRCERSTRTRLLTGSSRLRAAAYAQEEMMRRLAAGANSGRASTAEKTLERLKAEGTYVEKPFVPKKR